MQKAGIQKARILKEKLLIVKLLKVTIIEYNRSTYEPNAFTNLSGQPNYFLEYQIIYHNYILKGEGI